MNSLNMIPNLEKIISSISENFTFYLKAIKLHIILKGIQNC